MASFVSIYRARGRMLFHSPPLQRNLRWGGNLKKKKTPTFAFNLPLYPVQKTREYILKRRNYRQILTFHASTVLRSRPQKPQHVDTALNTAFDL